MQVVTALRGAVALQRLRAKGRVVALATDPSMVQFGSKARENFAAIKRIAGLGTGCRAYDCQPIWTTAR